MTDANEAPERIWADAPSIFDGSDVWHSEPDECRTEYIRKDVSDAAVAAERELSKALVKRLKCLEKYFDLSDEELEDMSHDERADTKRQHRLIKEAMAGYRTNTDALEAYRRQVRAEALREALGAIASLPLSKSEEVNEGIAQSYRTIEALIGEGEE